MLNLVHLQTFQAVLETGSLSAAGKRLGYTTSAVSQQVAALERGLGVRLFERGPRSLRPTHAAERVGLVAGSLLIRAGS
ncbi:LysR family transcriptional regulator [Streptomyces sp. NPDC002795]|uniref:LysR family transcriptional regulator n=1 Tax=Streptomyces sp. NPDC002795 TaxID=3364665 RepID=UPI00367E083F